MTARAVAAVTLAVTAGGLLAQVALTSAAFAADGRSVAAALWRLAGFFTIWSNSCVALAAAAALAGARLERTRVAVLPAILVVGVTYTLLLRPYIDEPSQTQLVVSSLLHDVTPLLFLGLVLALRAGRPPWHRAALATVLPLAFLAVGIVRGQTTGWFPYWFLNPAEVGTTGVVRSVALFAASFLALGGLVVAVERRRA